MRADVTRVAAVDCGTNSFRLLIAEAAPDGLRPLDRRMAITRLGSMVDATRLLQRDAVDRSVGVLREYGAAIREARCERVRMIATSAAREAENFDDFRSAACDAVGVVPEVISGDEEAALSFLGATAGLRRAEGPLLVVDIGGGSTEFVLGDAGGPPWAAVSTDMGSVRLTEKFLEHDPPAAAELAEAFSFVHDRLAEAESAVPVGEARRLVGVAGTITTLAAVALGLDGYDSSRIHHSVLTRGGVEDMFRRLCSETVEEHRADPAIDPARADVITAGALILAGVLRRWPFPEVLVSENDILDGVALSLVR